MQVFSVFVLRVPRSLFSGMAFAASGVDFHSNADGETWVTGYDGL
jgi:hypothetical protein